MKLLSIAVVFRRSALVKAIDLFNRGKINMIYLICGQMSKNEMVLTRILITIYMPKEGIVIDESIGIMGLVRKLYFWGIVKEMIINEIIVFTSLARFISDWNHFHDRFAGWMLRETRFRL